MTNKNNYELKIIDNKPFIWDKKTHSFVESDARKKFFRVGYDASIYIMNHAKGKQSKIISWLMINCSRQKNNAIRATYQQLAKKTHTSRGTVHSAIKLLEKVHYIKYSDSIWYLSPDLAMRGRSSRFRKLKEQYINLK